MTRSLLALLSVLVLANLAAWGWASAMFGGSAALMGLAVLAYTFGLRHGVDADHIAAIDNVTRKLMARGRRSWDVGLYFSLGHSTVVVALSVAVATIAGVLGRMEGMKAVGGIVGTMVSALFLLGIAIANLGLLQESWGRFRAVRQGRAIVDVSDATAPGGLGSRLFGRLFHRIGHGWQMYPLGFLFGLGFDTATEVGLLGLSAGQADKIDPWSILVFPALFAAGMSLIDTVDSAVMAGAYRWAFVKPVRKVYYNLTITFISVAMAVVVGGLEILGLAAEHWRLDGAVWSALAGLNDHLDLMGLGLIGVFAACWGVSIMVYRLAGYDGIEASAKSAAE